MSRSEWRKQEQQQQSPGLPIRYPGWRLRAAQVTHSMHSLHTVAQLCRQRLPPCSASCASTYCRSSAVPNCPLTAYRLMGQYLQHWTAVHWGAHAAKLGSGGWERLGLTADDARAGKSLDSRAGQPGQERRVAPHAAQAVSTPTHDTLHSC